MVQRQATLKDVFGYVMLEIFVSHVFRMLSELIVAIRL